MKKLLAGGLSLIVTVTLLAVFAVASGPPAQAGPPDGPSSASCGVALRFTSVDNGKVYWHMRSWCRHNWRLFGNGITLQGHARKATVKYKRYDSKTPRRQWDWTITQPNPKGKQNLQISIEWWDEHFTPGERVHHGRTFYTARY